jgi:hypothetical protein
VAHDQQADVQVGEEILQRVQGGDVEVVRGLIEDEDVRVLHQHGAEVEAAFLATAQRAHVLVLLLLVEEEALQQPEAVKVLPLLKGITSAMSRTTSMMRLSSFSCKPLLAEGAEDHGIAHGHGAGVGLAVCR